MLKDMGTGATLKKGWYSIVAQYDQIHHEAQEAIKEWQPIGSLRYAQKNTNNNDTIMHYDNNAIQMLWMSTQSWWLSMPCLMKNEANVYMMDFAFTASNPDISPANAQRSDPRM